jgi:hypothetical protein
VVSCASTVSRLLTRWVAAAQTGLRRDVLERVPW